MSMNKCSSFFNFNPADLCFSSSYRKWKLCYTKLRGNYNINRVSRRGVDEKVILFQLTLRLKYRISYCCLHLNKQVPRF